MIVMYARLSGRADSGHVVRAVVANIAMFTFTIGAMYAPSAGVWIALTVCSFCCYAFVTCSLILWQLWSRSVYSDKSSRVVLKTTAPFALFAWVAFPLIWILREANVINDVVCCFCWPILDIIAKSSFALLGVFGDFIVYDAQIERELSNIAQQRSAAEAANDAKKKVRDGDCFGWLCKQSQLACAGRSSS